MSPQTARFSNPLWHCIQPLTVCLLGSSNRTIPSDGKACDGPTALSASSSAEAVLVPQYEGPITNPYSGSHWSVPEGVILVEPSPLNRLTTVEPDTNLDSHRRDVCSQHNRRSQNYTTAHRRAHAAASQLTMQLRPSVMISLQWLTPWHTFQEMAQALPTKPSSQGCWRREKIAYLGHGVAHLTVLNSLPPPSSALPIVLRLSIVAYFGMPMADLSLEKRMGQQVWSKRGGVGNRYQGPSLLTLVQHAKAVLKPLAHIHRSRVLHRGLTPDHVLLFSKGGQEADSGVRAASKPDAIKHDIKLTGFGAAARLTGKGCAIETSPYKCGVGAARMAANPQCLPSTLSAQTRTVKRKAAAGATHSPASTQRASAVAEQGLGVAISAPTLMLGVHQWLPEESVRCADHSQGTPSNHHAASGSQQSHGGLALAGHGIWDEVMQVKASGNLVIASMWNLAASTGCEIADAADRVVVQH
ncbi:hypothetical protein WJX79_008034 [Trebouxia sp. C0005]